MRCGEEHPGCRHSDALVAEVKRRHTAGETIYALAKEHGICYRTAYDWCRGMTRAEKKSGGIDAFLRRAA